MKRALNSFSMIIYTLLLGSITGIIIWLFLKVMNIGIDFLWNYIPSQLNISFYTIIICLIGSIIIGLFKKKYGNYPEELNEVITEVKKNHR